MSIGTAGIFFFLLKKKEILGEFEKLIINDKKLFYLFFSGILIAGSLASYLYYYSYNRSNGRTHIVIPITLILPSILAIIGTSLLFKEKIKVESIIGVILIVVGTYILIMNNK